MPEDGGCDYFSDLTTAPIFDDAVFHSEALNLADGQNEDTLDERLVISARESGVEDPQHYLCAEVEISTATSTMTVDSERRSSMSIHSRETQSTGMTSHPSRTSRDNPFLEPQSPTLRSPPTSRGLPSPETYDAFVNRFRPALGHKHSSSSTSAGDSFLSTASSAPKPATKKRTSGLFSMFRRDTSTCPSRSHHGHHGKPSSPKLDCGHSLSKYAIRVHVQEALESNEHVAPTCCGRPIPRSVLALVLTQKETDLVMTESLQLPTYNSPRDSGYSEQAMSCIDLPLSSKTRSPPASFVTGPATPCRDVPREDKETLDQALANEAFTSLRAQQKEQFHRVSHFESNQRKALAAYHQWSLNRLSSRFETVKAERTKQHALELERLDESQIMAEHDLRKSQAQETQNVATALKYMEAYCSGANCSDPEITHTVTDDDRNKLARQRALQDKLPQKHDSAINVLRARQEKDAKLKLQKQEVELRQLDTDYQHDVDVEETQFAKETSRLDSVIEARRKKILSRWDLKFEIWRRDWEAQHKTILHGRLPHENWPQRINDQEPIDASSSLALYTHVTV